MWNLAEIVFVLALASGPESIPSAPQSPLAGAVPAAGQFLGLSPGDKVRFATAGERGTTVGSVVAADSDTLLLTLPGADKTVRLPWPSLKKLEVHRGQHSNTGRGFKIGAFIAGIPCAVIGFLSRPRGYQENYSHTALELLPAVYAGAVGAGLGGFAGMLIGSAVDTDRWDKVGLPSVQVNVTPQRRDGMAVALSLRF